MAKLNKSILVVGTYPIVSPRHGGQKRLDAIVEEYKKNFAEVKYVSVFFEGFYAEYSKDDIALGREGEIKVHQSPMTGDITCGESIFYDPEVKEKFSAVLVGMHPDIIHIEQPYPYLGLKPLLDELRLQPKIIFGSQNIEAPMKGDILKEYNMPIETTKKIEKDIHVLEKDLSRVSDLTVACTASDLEEHKKMGSRRTVLAANGVSELMTTQTAESYWKNMYESMGIKQTAVFVGSAHPPNWAGFLRMIGKGLGFVPHTARIVAAGSISDFFDREISEDSLDIQDVTFWKRAFSAGRLSEDKLRAIINVADVILLPITEGGGSNLKTAEAIIADKKVVATSHALRSFEWFRDFPNVWIADTPEEFKKSITKALAANRVDRTEKQQRQAESVLWENCLKKLIENVREL
jgi:hypothetical protein